MTRQLMDFKPSNHNQMELLKNEIERRISESETLFKKRLMSPLKPQISQDDRQIEVLNLELQSSLMGLK